jgi:predicted peroxiredoxin
MKIVRPTIALALLCLIGITLPAALGDEPVRDGVFIHLSHGSDDPHRALMALRMAEIMSEDKDVLVYFDIKAIDLVVKGAPDLTLEPFPTSEAMFGHLVSRGVILMACPGCLKAAGKSSEDLREGIKLADKETFFSFTSGRILSLDY